VVRAVLVRLHEVLFRDRVARARARPRAITGRPRAAVARAPAAPPAAEPGRARAVLVPAVPLGLRRELVVEPRLDAAHAALVPLLLELHVEQPVHARVALDRARQLQRRQAVVRVAQVVLDHPLERVRRARVDARARVGHRVAVHARPQLEVLELREAAAAAHAQVHVGDRLGHGHRHLRVLHVRRREQLLAPPLRLEERRAAAVARAHRLAQQRPHALGRLRPLAAAGAEAGLGRRAESIPLGITFLRIFNSR